MKVLKAFYTRTKYTLGRMLRETGLGNTKSQSPKISALDASGSRMSKDIAYLEPLSRHRSIMPLYDLRPLILLDTYVAPNATLIGEVIVGAESTIWYGAVLRGDMHAIRYTFSSRSEFIRIGNNCSIGDNTVIHTAGSLPTGIPASVNIGSFVNIGNNCTLYSCTIDDECYVGFKSIILEGAQLERGCAIGPNSVVPPGRVIPSGQLWAGNPVEYVRDLSKGEKQNHIHALKQNLSISMDHRYEFLPYNSAYLQRENTKDDLEVTPERIRDRGISHDRFQTLQFFMKNVDYQYLLIPVNSM